MSSPLRVRELFEAALAQPPESWNAWLDSTCDDAATAQRVKQLLESHRDSRTFMSAPAIRPAKPHLDFVGQSIGPYRLVEQIGEGGMGVVYIAQQKQPLQREVAIKVIKPGMDSRQVIARFEAERQALALMDHPHIARVIDGGATSEGRPYFVMELVRGLPLTQFCDEAQLSIRERLELFVKVCQAVQHAHQKGIIHRDLKPSNVLVAKNGDLPVPKVIDFGVAKAMHQPLTDKTLHTQVSQVIGSPLYMSPEQARLSALDIDTRSDVYSLGVLLYELLTGATPFVLDEETGLDELRRKVVEQEPARPSQRASTLAMAAGATIAEQRKCLDPRRLQRALRGELDWIVLRALEKDRARRYQSPGELAADIERHLTNQPVAASPPSAWYRWRKFVRRHRGSLAAASIVVVALVTGTGISLWQAAEARRARELSAASYAEARNAVKTLLDEVAREQAYTTPGGNKLYHALMDKTIEAYGKLLKINPKDASIYADRGDAFAHLHRFDEAQADYERAARLEPNAPRHMIAIATTVSRFRNKRQATQAEKDLGLQIIRRALAVEPNNKVARLTYINILADSGRHDEMRQELIRFEKQFDFDAESWTKISYCLHHNLRDPQAALPYAEKAVAEAPKNGDAHFQLACILGKLHRFDESLHEFDEAIRFHRNLGEDDLLAWVYRHRGEVYTGMGDDIKAVQDFDRYIELSSPQNRSAWGYWPRIEALMRLKRYPEALRDIEAAADLNGGDKSSTLYRYKPEDIVKTGDQEFQEGMVKLYSKYVKSMEDPKVPRHARSALLLKMGRYADAAEDLVELARANPNPDPNLVIRAVFCQSSARDGKRFATVCKELVPPLIESGNASQVFLLGVACVTSPETCLDKKQMRRIGQRMKELDSRHFELIVGAIHYRLGELHSARQLLREAIRRNPVEAHYFLALTELAAGNREAAEEWYELAAKEYETYQCREHNSEIELEFWASIVLEMLDAEAKGAMRKE